jgi:ABC-type sugar transport system permease subunit
LRTRTFLGFSLPSIVLMAGLMALPVVATVWLSLHAVTFRGDWRFVGFLNYETTFEDPDFWRSLTFTLQFLAVAVPAKILLGFGIALALDKVAPGIRGFFIACALLPFVVTPVVGTLAFSWLFRDFGVVNYWITQATGLRIFWFGSEAASRALVILHDVWQGAPFAVIVLFAGLQTVPKDQLEAAIVDGANVWYRLGYVVIPHLKSLFIFLALMMIMDGYRIFDSIAVMTKGVNGTESVMWYNYRVAILENAVPRGSAISVLTVLGILVILIPFLWMTYREQREAR